MFGGTGNDAQNSWFSYVEAPFNTPNLNWVAIPTTGSHNASSRPACGVTSAGMLIVTGGEVSTDPNYSGIQVFDLTKGMSGLDTIKYLTYRNSHGLVIFTTSAGEEVLFQFGGSLSNDTYLLHISNMTWEMIPLDSTTPPLNGLFGIAYSKDNFDPKTTMPTVWGDGHIGHLNDTFYIVSSDNSGPNSPMRIWTLSNNSFYTFNSGPMTTVGHEYYASTQLPGSDALLTYGGSTKNSSAVGDINTYLGNTADLLIFNMTQQKWVTTYNYVTNAPMDQFIGGLLAPNQNNPFLKPISQGNNTNNIDRNGTSSSTSNNSISNNNSSPIMLYIIIGGVVLVIILVIVAIIGYRIFHLPKPGFYSNSNSSNSILTTLAGAPHTIRVHATVNSRFKDEIFSHHKLNAMVYEQPDAVVIMPSAPTGTIIFQRYRLCGNLAYGGNKTIRQAIDEQTDDQYVGELLALYELPSKKDWPYIIILNYYPQTIHHLHTHNIAHLDIKPGNFVHEKNNPTKWWLVDLEAARFVGEEYVDDCSPKYCPSEIFNAAYNKQPIIALTSMDIWSLGCIIFELYTKTPLFYSEEVIDKLTKSFTRGELVDFPLNKIPDQQARNILSKILTDSMDVAIPRLYVLLPGQDTGSIFRPQTWGKNTFILHLLCEGLEPNNQEAHFTQYKGYEIHDPKPLLRKAGVSINHAFHLNSSPDISGLISSISTRPTKYFKQLTKTLDSEITYLAETRDIESTTKDPVGRMKMVQGSALRELKAFLEVNNKVREWGWSHTCCFGKWTMAMGMRTLLYTYEDF
ncbi:10877_t:CDS:10 [Gigaspora rosea]|nr:10877_t:CDS:10 [Gigaspora rosea]